MISLFANKILEYQFGYHVFFCAPKFIYVYIIFSTNLGFFHKNY